MKITKITIGRLYNLGSYEHVRYELSAEVPEGESAAEAFMGLAKIINAIKPISKCGVKSDIDLTHQRKEVESMRSMPVAEWERRYGHCKGTPSEVLQRYEESLAEETKRRNEALARAKKAAELFDDLGGAAEWKDAKLSWDNDEF